jgi:hypothetical protein
MRIVPAQVPVEGLGVGVDEQLVVVEPVPAFRIVGAVDPIAIELAGAHIREVAVPDLVRVFRQRHPVGLALAFRIEEAEFDLLGVRGEQREIDAAAVPGRAKRIGQAWLDPMLNHGWGTS